MTIAVPKPWIARTAPVAEAAPWPASAIRLLGLAALGAAGLSMARNQRARRRVAAISLASLMLGFALLTGCSDGGKATLFNVTVTAMSPTAGTVTAPVSLTVN